MPDICSYMGGIQYGVPDPEHPPFRPAENLSFYFFREKKKTTLNLFSRPDREFLSPFVYRCTRTGT